MAVPRTTGAPRFLHWAAYLHEIPKALIAGLLLLAIVNMLAGVFLRYVMVEITDYLDTDPISFFWVEEVGEFALAWLTLVGAGIAVAERAHFTLHVFTHRLPQAGKRAVEIFNHLLIAGFGGLAAWYGLRLVSSNSALTSPGLQINLGWLYASAVAGGLLILIYAVSIMLAGDGESVSPLPPTPEAAGGP